MEEKKIIVSLQEWDEMQQEVMRLRNQLYLEREKFKGKAQSVLLESVMAKLGLRLYRNIPLAVYTDDPQIFKSIDSLRKLIEDNFNYKNELEYVKSMSVWKFLMMKLKE